MTATKAERVCIDSPLEEAGLTIGPATEKLPSGVPCGFRARLHQLGEALTPRGTKSSNPASSAAEFVSAGSHGRGRPKLAPAAKRLSRKQKRPLPSIWAKAASPMRLPPRLLGDLSAGGHVRSPLLLPPPLSASDHPACGLGLPALHVELSRRRGTPGRARARNLFMKPSGVGF